MNNIVSTNQLWARCCPRCKREIVYAQETDCLVAFQMEVLCPECSAPRLPGGQSTGKKGIKKPRLKYNVVSEQDENFLAISADKKGALRICPDCGNKVWHYSTRILSAEAAARNAIKSKTSCQKCKIKKRNKEGTNKFVEGNKLFFNKHHTEETKDKVSKTISEKCKVLGSPTWAWGKTNWQPSGSFDNNCGCYPVVK